MAKQRRKNHHSPTLPIDIISHEILARLPLKPLLKCRCVSKLWRSVIDEPSFTGVHVQKCQKNKEKSRLLVLEGYNKSYSKRICSIRNSLKFRRISSLDIDLHWLRRYQPVGHINGVFCLKKYTLRNQPSKIVLWNPSIKKALEVGFPQIANAVAVHSKQFDIDCAFGYDPVRNDYKLVASAYIGTGYHIPAFVQVFTLSTFSWKDITLVPSRLLWCKDANKKVFLNGVVYWSGTHITTMIGNGRLRFTHLVAFDVAREVFNFIDLPAYEHPEGGPGQADQDRFPIILDQSVGLMETFEGYSQIWIMKEERDKGRPSWSKRYTINLQILNKCLYFDINGEVLFTTGTGWVKSYNVKTQETKVLHKSYKSAPSFTCVYMETLALLTGLPPRTPLIKFPPPPRTD